MAVWRSVFVVALIAAAGIAHAQTQDKAENAGTAAAVSESQKTKIPAAGCVTYAYTNTREGFNYTAFLGLAKLPAGCVVGDISILKQYTSGACPETRANNYPVKGLGIKNTCTDPITKADATTCLNAFAKAPKEALVPGMIGAGSMVDEGKVCWKTPMTFYFIRNKCKSPITATIKVTTDRYTGECTGEVDDTDDGGDDVGGKVTDSTTAGAPDSSARSLSAGAVGSAIVGLMLAAVQL